MPGKTRDEKIDEMIAKDEIRDLALTYSRAVDRKDFVLLGQLYFPDAGDEHGGNTTGTAKEFIELMPGWTEKTLVLAHNITNHLIKVDGDYAEGEVYALAYCVNDVGEGKQSGFLQGVRYLDKYRRKNGIWKFAHRRVVTDYLLRSDPPPAELEGAPEILGMRIGASDANDHSYGFFSLLQRGVR